MNEPKLIAANEHDGRGGAVSEGETANVACERGRCPGFLCRCIGIQIDAQAEELRRLREVGPEISDFASVPLNTGGLGAYRALLRTAMSYHFPDVLEAAHRMLATIEELTAENARLREELEAAKGTHTPTFAGSDWCCEEHRVKHTPKESTS